MSSELWTKDKVPLSEKHKLKPASIAKPLSSNKAMIFPKGPCLVSAERLKPKSFLQPASVE
jgi:hypothetical protein